MFPFTIAAKVLPCAMWDTVIGIWFAYIGQVSLGVTTPGSRPATKALPYQTPTILVAWITAPHTDAWLGWISLGPRFIEILAQMNGQK